MPETDPAAEITKEVLCVCHLRVFWLFIYVYIYIDVYIQHSQTLFWLGLYIYLCNIFPTDVKSGVHTSHPARFPLRQLRKQPLRPSSEFNRNGQILYPPAVFLCLRDMLWCAKGKVKGTTSIPLMFIYIFIELHVCENLWFPRAIWYDLRPVPALL